MAQVFTSYEDKVLTLTEAELRRELAQVQNAYRIFSALPPTTVGTDYLNELDYREGRLGAALDEITIPGGRNV